MFFSGDSYELRDEGKVVLDEVSQIISEVSSSIDEIRVLGHTAQAVPGRVNNVTADRFPGFQPCHSGYYLPTGKRHN